MDALVTEAGSSAKIKVYSGTQPSGGGAPSGTLLGTLTCASAFAPSSSGGVLTLNSITGDSDADATGAASWFRITKSDDTWIMDGDITISGGGGDLHLDSISVVIGGTISLGGPNTLTAPNAA